MERGLHDMQQKDTWHVCWTPTFSFFFIVPDMVSYEKKGASRVTDLTEWNLIYFDCDPLTKSQISRGNGLPNLCSVAELCETLHLLDL